MRSAIVFPIPEISALPVNVSFVHPAIILGSWFGMGLIEPLRAGLAVASVWPLAVLASRRSATVLLSGVLLIALAGGWAADAWEALVSVKDDRRLVIDEVAGYLAIMMFLRRSGWLAAGVLAAIFLALDRLKPWPMDRIEGIPGGVGVMLDDIVLGLVIGLGVLLTNALRRGIVERQTLP